MFSTVVEDSVADLGLHYLLLLMNGNLIAGLNLIHFIFFVLLEGTCLMALSK